MKKTIFCFLIFLTACISVIAKENQQAHVHGLATLTLALENEELEIQFESPAANIAGFEHNAHSPEEKQAVTAAETILKSPELLFSFAGADCIPTETAVDISGVMDNEHDHHHHSEGHDDSSHSEIKSHYHFNCKNAKNLDSISITIFSQFPRIEKINAMWVIETLQGAELLSPSKNTISLR